MDQSVDNLNVEDEEKSIFKDLRNFLIKNLDVNNEGKIKPTVKNLRTVQRTKFIKNILLNDEYRESVKEFTDTFGTVSKMNEDFIDGQLS